MMSLSSHKINGPKGVGALYIRSNLKILPIIHGGGRGICGQVQRMCPAS